MPIFACKACGVIENTAVGDYWNRREDPRCSECSPRFLKWHGLFPREPADNGRWMPDPDLAGFLVRKTEPKEILTS